MAISVKNAQAKTSGWMLALCTLSCACLIYGCSDDSRKMVAKTVYKGKGETVTALAQASGDDAPYLIWTDIKEDDTGSTLHWMNTKTGKENHIDTPLISAVLPESAGRTIIYSTCTFGKSTIYTFDIPENGDSAGQPQSIIEVSGRIFYISGDSSAISYALADVSTDPEHDVSTFEKQEAMLHAYYLEPNYRGEDGNGDRMEPHEFWSDFKTPERFQMARGKDKGVCLSLKSSESGDKVECYEFNRKEWGELDVQSSTLVDNLAYLPRNLVWANGAVCWYELFHIYCLFDGEEYPLRLPVEADDAGIATDGDNIFYAGETFEWYRFSIKDRETYYASPKFDYGLGMIRFFVVIDGKFYWPEFKDYTAFTHLTGNILSANAYDTYTEDKKPSSSSSNPFCSSFYNGTWKGTFNYRLVDSQDNNTVEQADIEVELTLNCLQSVLDMEIFNITHAKVSHPFFGCTEGCDISSLLSIATLPDNKNTQSTSAGQGIVVQFPNGSQLLTSNFVGELTVSNDGKKLSNTGDCNADQRTWGAINNTTGQSLADLNGQTYLSYFPCWQLNKQ